MTDINHAFEGVTAKDDSHVIQMTFDVAHQAYPKFVMAMKPEILASWDAFYQAYPDLQYAVRERATGIPVGECCCIPLAWEPKMESLPKEGSEWALLKGIDDYKRGLQPKTLAIISLSVIPTRQSQGLGEMQVRWAMEMASSLGFKSLILAVRPTLKNLYPLTPIERYITWHDANGLPFDPWLRTIVRLGAEIVGICEESATVIHTVAAWEALTGMRFPESGDYVVPSALVPVTIDREQDQGIYIEPNVWMTYQRA